MKLRGRPKKYRIVRANPKISQFSPRGKPGRPDEVDLAIDEFETVRLSDYMGLSQKEAAKSMQISQQTFSRILKKARRKLAIAIINGDIIKIKGGTYVITNSEKIELIPLETKEREFTNEEYAKLEALAAKEKGKEKHVTKKFIDNLKKGKT